MNQDFYLNISGLGIHGLYAVVNYPHAIEVGNAYGNERRPNHAIASGNGVLGGGEVVMLIADATNPRFRQFPVPALCVVSIPIVQTDVSCPTLLCARLFLLRAN